ncbi:hypothetical protein DXG03_005534 [Asterophora parasitica]|uniref:Uncharacterized protein n=1 Tax=Asterophora parasitica TaxID=117018 RepID=A0A9P7G3A0_9AGAR|nr:hypothetical protein DXG03_005534 [Asterophora parasitica]
MQLISSSKLYALVFVLSAVTLAVEAGPVPVKKAVAPPATKGNGATGTSPPKTSSLHHNVCKPRKGPVKYKPIPKGKKEFPRKGQAGAATGKPAAGSVQKGPPAASKPKEGKKKRADFSDEAELFARAYTPAQATGKIKLYHGAEQDITAVDLSKSSQGGDFSNGPSFYLTDRERAALQFACLSNSVFYLDTQAEIDAAEMYVIEFEWDGAGANIHTFTGTGDADWKGYQEWIEKCDTNDKYSKIHDKDMVVGPMQKEIDQIRGITNNFWQYVVMNADAAKTHLRRVGSKKLKCEPQGRGGNFD